MPEDHIERPVYEDEHEGLSLGSIDADRQLSECTDASKIIKKNGFENQTIVSPRGSPSNRNCLNPRPRSIRIAETQ